MVKPTKITIFEGRKIRRHWDGKKEKWYFSVVDIVQILSNQVDFTKARKYWNKLAERLRTEGSEAVTKCHQLRMLAADGKMRLTDVADTETMFRIIQAIPSPNAEPLKLWLARVGFERVEELEDPEKAIQRALRFYLKRGYSQNWVNQRLKSIEIRKELTDEWEERGVEESNQFATLTDEITFAWAGMRTKDYKKYKNLKKENLRDNMTNLELVLNMLAEVSTTEISKKVEPKDFEENKKVAKEGGSIAGLAKRRLESKLKKKVVTKLNAKNLGLLE
ncbi:MAG: BRO family protein [Candidatus Daviesbacteria bacterium]|nr:BRO family protein [Candidatus Daviesbacteria bacterium]